MNIDSSIYITTSPYIGVAAGPAGQVLAGPLLSKVKWNFMFAKSKQLAEVLAWLLGLLG